MPDIDALIKKIGILVVDDMESMRSLVGGCLRNLGAEKIYPAGNGESAWNLLNNKRINLIICDWDMPQVSGLELLTRVRESDVYKHIPFLMLTATTDKKNVMGAIAAGVNDYLAKPFKPQDLEYRVIKLLRKVKLSENQLSAISG